MKTFWIDYCFTTYDQATITAKNRKDALNKLKKLVPNAEYVDMTEVEPRYLGGINREKTRRA